MDENLKLQKSRHADNTTALRELAEKLDQHAAAVAMIRPTVASLELSRSKLATWASIGLGAVMVLGWIVEAGAKWCCPGRCRIFSRSKLRANLLHA